MMKNVLGIVCMLARQKHFSVLLCSLWCDGSGGPAQIRKQGHNFLISVADWKSCLNYYKDSCVLLKRVSLQFSLGETIRCLRIKLLKIVWYEPGKSGVEGLFLLSFMHLG